MATNQAAIAEQQPDVATSWCSWCFQRCDHALVQSSRFGFSLYQCRQCLQPTVACKVPGCKHMARTTGANSDWYCAEHGGLINSFARFDATIKDPTEFVDLITKRDTADMRAVVNKIGAAAAGLAVIGPASLVLAPAVGGIIGTAFLGLNGAAATSAGLALLGGGSVAAGGLGMLGGAAAIAGAGTIGGGWLGYLLSSHLLAEVDGFRIERLAEGADPALVFIDGFLTEGRDNGAMWLAGLREKYAGHAAYYEHWEGKTLQSLGKSFIELTTPAAATEFAQMLAAQASTVNAARLGWAAIPLLAWGLAKHPWFRAMLCAERTGLLVQQALMRCESRSFILLGHSLGARAVARALTAVGASPVETRKSRIVAAHLVGGAEGIGPAEKWSTIGASVDDRCYAYYSKNDTVLRYLYQVGTLFDSAAIGCEPIEVPPLATAKVHSIDVTEHVAGHSGYKGALRQFIR